MDTPGLRLERLQAGQHIVYGGDRVAIVGDDLAAAFRVGDSLVVVQTTGDLLHVPAADRLAASAAVDGAMEGFTGMRLVDDTAVSRFYDEFARRLGDDATFAPIAAANETDVASAMARGRSTTRLRLDAAMREGMIAALRMWRDLPGGRERTVEAVAHDGWSVEARTAPLGVVAFVFEGRPNVFADATGVLRSGNAVVFRIGSDALGTARAVMDHALRPALVATGLPSTAVQLVDSPAHAAGWALFSDARLALAVARGSGPAVAQLGAVARQAGVPVSLHGTGGAWLVASQHADPARLAAVVHHSLDRKVCNTLNVCCITRDAAEALVPIVLHAADEAAAARGAKSVVHALDGVDLGRPAEPVTEDELAVEWEWEHDPELTVAVVESVDGAIDLFNRHSPHFIASLVSEDANEQQRFWDRIDAPFVADGFTRWVDGQYALGRPELGLSNWQGGRLFARGGVLSGDGVFTIRLRATQTNPDLHR